MPFAPGKSGNPDGRPKGARGKVTLARDALFSTRGQAVREKLEDLGKRGHWFALDALFGPGSLVRSKREARGLGEPRTGDGAQAALILEALAVGEIGTTEATVLLEACAGRLQTLADRLLTPTSAGAKKAGEGVASLQNRAGNNAPSPHASPNSTEDHRDEAERLQSIAENNGNSRAPRVPPPSATARRRANCSAENDGSDAAAQSDVTGKWPALVNIR